ncbi:MAG: ABC transporter permease [Thermoleophilaceae bacterium]
MRRQRGRIRELAVHLTLRQLASTHRFTVLGWAWPLTRQLAQLAVLVFLFSHVLDLHVHDYAVFVFAGLISWSWFSTALDSATSSLIANRHLVFQPRFPPAVLPVVAVAAGLVDVLIALPVLVVMLAISGDLAWTIVLLPLLFAVQFVLTCGVAWITSVATVYLRDVRGIVAVGLTVLFYLTPVFYDVARVPHRYEWVLRLNPLTTLIDGYRALLLGSDFPSVARAAAVVAASAALAAAGAALFTRFSPGIVDEL